MRSNLGQAPNRNHTIFRKRILRFLSLQNQAFYQNNEKKNQINIQLLLPSNSLMAPGETGVNVKDIVSRPRSPQRHMAWAISSLIAIVRSSSSSWSLRQPLANR